jgi:uncharacterized membrane protein YuzA (DUF378 family)
MAAQVARSLNSSALGCSRERMLAALFGCTMLAAAAIGVVGVLGVSWCRQMLESWINVHVLFELLLCGLLLIRWRWYVGQLPRTLLPADICGLSRHLSRIVYLVLYLVIGVREIIVVLNGLLHDGAADFNLLNDPIRNGPDHGSWNPNDDFQLFFASGLLALLFVRILAYGLWSRSGRRAAASKARPPAFLRRASKILGIDNP